MLKFQLLIPWLHLTNSSVPFQEPIAEAGPSLIKPIQTLRLAFSTQAITNLTESDTLTFSLDYQTQVCAQNLE